MKLIQLRGVRLLKLFQIQGIVVYPFILFAPRKPSVDLQNHERIHAEQIQRDGVMNFYTQYLLEYFFLRLGRMGHDEAYRNISYEWEAYRHHHDSDYKVATRS